jgi:cold shock CspA family protein
MPRGVVATWDEHRGYGTIRDDETGAEHFFHCTQLLDGTRTIDDGAPVEFELAPGHLGRWEATRITKH